MIQFEIIFLSFKKRKGLEITLLVHQMFFWTFFSTHFVIYTLRNKFLNRIVMGNPKAYFLIRLRRIFDKIP